jgi:hypothetical protein
MKQFSQAREQLEKFGIRDSGDYAEVLVAKALGAARNTRGVQKGCDLLCAKLGRIEVRSRTLPRDGRNETRLEVPKEKANGFDVFAGVLFAADMSVIGGFLLPHDEALALAESQKYLRIPFQVGAAHRRQPTSQHSYKRRNRMSNPAFQRTLRDEAAHRR